jgi:ankyrin repeat protein
VPLNSTRFREDISRADAEPALYFDDQKVQRLCRSINSNKLDEMHRFIAAGVNVNAQGDGGITPLVWALAQSKPEAIKLLLKSNADPDLRLSDRIHLRGTYSNIGDNFFTLLASFNWISRELYRDAIPYSKNINQRSPNGDTLLMIFARQWLAYGFDKVTCDALVAAGVDLNAQNNLGDSVCTLSSSEPEKCLWFIEHGANPTLRRHDGKELLDLLKSPLERIEKLRTDETSWRNQESPTARADRLGQDQQLLRLRDKVIDYKRTMDQVDKKPDDKAEKANEH